MGPTGGSIPIASILSSACCIMSSTNCRGGVDSNVSVTTRTSHSEAPVGGTDYGATWR